MTTGEPARNSLKSQLPVQGTVAATPQECGGPKQITVITPQGKITVGTPTQSPGAMRRRNALRSPAHRAGNNAPHGESLHTHRETGCHALLQPIDPSRKQHH